MTDRHPGVSGADAAHRASPGSGQGRGRFAKRRPNGWVPGHASSPAGHRQSVPQAGGGDRPDAAQLRREAARTAYAGRSVWRLYRSAVAAVEWEPGSRMARRFGMDDAQARRVRAWIDGYVRAWNSNDPADIRALFTQEAAYYTEPYGPPWEGRDEIVHQWLDRKASLARPSSPGTRSPLPPRSPSSRVRSPIPVRATPTAICGSSASTPRVAAPSSPSGGCATLSPTSRLLRPQTSRRPAPQASAARPSAEGGGLPGRHRTRPGLSTGGWSDEPGGVGREVLHGGPPW
jgi:hypothetical protein